jgi:cation transport regulator
MSDKTNNNGSASVRDRFPQEVEALYQAAFRSALDWYGDESQASKVAWRAVRHAAASLNSDFGQDFKFLITSEYQASPVSSTTTLVN